MTWARWSNVWRLDAVFHVVSINFGLNVIYFFFYRIKSPPRHLFIAIVFFPSVVKIFQLLSEWYFRDRKPYILKLNIEWKKDDLLGIGLQFMFTRPIVSFKMKWAHFQWILDYQFSKWQNKLTKWTLKYNAFKVWSNKVHWFRLLNKSRWKIHTFLR